MAFIFKTDPFPHQLEEFEKYRDTPFRALWWDMGCVDADTEYLAPDGWHKISKYKKGTLVAQWGPSGTAEFVKPTAYIIRSCKWMYHFKNRFGLDQMLSPEHRMPYYNSRNRFDVMSAEQMSVGLRMLSNTHRKLPAVFTLDMPGHGIPLSDADLALQTAIIQNGCFAFSGETQCRVKLKCKWKIGRLKILIDHAGIEYKSKQRDDGLEFWLNAPMRLRQFPKAWWRQITNHQRDIILNVIFTWNNEKKYFSLKKANIDFIQYLLASTGKMVAINKEEVTPRQKESCFIRVHPQDIKEVVPKDGKKYCFEVPSSFLIYRRNGKIFPSGNTGKSKPIIDTMAYLYGKGKIDAGFILAPEGVHANWSYDEIPDHMPGNIPYECFTWETSKKGTKKYKNSFSSFLEPEDSLKLLSMTYSALMTNDGRKAAKDYFKKHRCFYVADETTLIKTPGAKTTIRVIASAPYAPYRRALNGTPVEDSPFHAYSQVRFVDPDFWRRKFDIRRYLDFKAFFGVWEECYRKDGRKYPNLVNYKNMDLLSEALFEIGSACKEDVLDLPPKEYRKIYYELSPPQQRLYDELRDEYITAFDSGDVATADLAIVRLTRLQQICSGYLPADNEEDLRLIDSRQPRLKLLMSTLDFVPGSCIIWAKYNVDIDSIAKELAKKEQSFAIYDGRVSPQDKLNAKRDFQQQKVRYLLGKPSAAGRGLTLTAASTAIYYNFDFSSESMRQSAKRNHRIGQTKHVNYIFLVARGTVDEHIIKIHKSKQKNSAIIMRDSLKDWI